jgi:hypothetical protein
VLGEGRIVFEELRFEVEEVGVDVGVFVFVVGAGGVSGYGAVDSPVVVIGAKGVVIVSVWVSRWVVSSSAPLFASVVVRGQVGDGLHSDLRGQGFAVSKVLFESFSIFESLPDVGVGCPSSLEPGLQVIGSVELVKADFFFLES